jgi:hypothetical protein
MGGTPAREKKKPRVGVGPPGERKEEVEVLVLGLLISNRSAMEEPEADPFDSGIYV